MELALGGILVPPQEGQSSGQPLGPVKRAKALPEEEIRPLGEALVGRTTCREGMPGWWPHARKELLIVLNQKLSCRPCLPLKLTDFHAALCPWAMPL